MTPLHRITTTPQPFVNNIPTLNVVKRRVRDDTVFFCCFILESWLSCLDLISTTSSFPFFVIPYSRVPRYYPPRAQRPTRASLVPTAVQDVQPTSLATSNGLFESCYQAFIARSFARSPYHEDLKRRLITGRQNEGIRALPEAFAASFDPVFADALVGWSVGSG